MLSFVYSDIGRLARCASLALSRNIYIMSSMSRSYADAIACLNMLQSNAATIEELRRNGDALNELSNSEMQSFLNRIGYNVNDLNALNLVHITGTKGKGSTAAFCECMLRHSSVSILSQQNEHLLPIKTGLFTSPHLQEVRERIRINGIPIAQDLFARYFFDVWDRLESSKSEAIANGQLDKPRYFRFLTLVAFHAFTLEKTNATILEVGVGGQFDCTNVITQPIVTGITSLGYDHMPILGNTLTSIASHKGGIMKNSTPCFTVPQEPEALQSLIQKAKERNTSLCIVAPLSSDVKLGLQGEHQRLNAALAVALVQHFLTQTGMQLLSNDFPLPQTYALTEPLDAKLYSSSALADKYKSTTSTQLLTNISLYPTCVTEPMRRGLEQTFWPGRSYIYHKYTITWCMDGAHTAESIAVCADWFSSVIVSQPSTTITNKINDGQLKVLLFNLTHARNGKALLKPLADLHATHPFTHAIFCTNLITCNQYSKGDLVNKNEEQDDKLEQQQTLRKIWTELTGMSEALTSVQRSITEAVEHIITLTDVPDRTSIASTGKIIKDNNVTSRQVLVTGSLHLVGGLMAALHCDIQ